MVTLNGRKIAILEHRQSAELVRLVYELGGVPVAAPAMDQIVCHDDFNTFFDGLASRRFSIAIFLSGEGTAALLAEAERRGRLSATLGALRQVSIATRGAKPMAALRRHGVRPQITTAPPHTSDELMRALSCIDVSDRGVVLVHYGKRNLAVADALRQRGARLKEICPYEWALPEDLGPITGIVRDVIAHRVDAVLFTNQTQCRHLFQVASEMSRAEGLALSLNQQIVVGALGPICAKALKTVGVTPDVIPSAHTLPSLITAVAEYFDKQPSRI